MNKHCGFRDKDLRIKNENMVLGIVTVTNTVSCTMSVVDKNNRHDEDEKLFESNLNQFVHTYVRT